MGRTTMDAKKDWEKQWRQTMFSMNDVSTVSYWNRRAEDYNDFIRTSQFSYGETIVEILSSVGFLQPNMNVLEIAAGVGALTLPLCKRVNEVTTIKPAVKMAEKLQSNAKMQQISNMKLQLETCQQAAKRDDLPPHDCAVMCHASWQFPDLHWLMDFMEKSGNGSASISDSIPQKGSSKLQFCKKLGIGHHSFDRFSALHKVLTSYGRQIETEKFPFIMKRSVQSATAMLTQVLNKYRKPDTGDLNQIDDFVAANSRNGIYEEEATMGVLWWQHKHSIQ